MRKFLNLDYISVLNAIFQGILDARLTPLKWQQSLFIMIPKKSNTEKIDKFSPITLNSRLNLCFNKLLDSKLIDSFEYKELILDEQFGFIKHNTA